MKNKAGTIIMTGIFGAIVGIIAGFLFTRQSSEEEPNKVTPSQGAKVGLSVLSLVKQIADLGKPPR